MSNYVNYVIYIYSIQLANHQSSVQGLQSLISKLQTNTACPGRFHTALVAMRYLRVDFSKYPLKVNDENLQSSYAVELKTL